MNGAGLYLNVPHLRLDEDMEEVLRTFPLTDDGGQVLQQTGGPGGESRGHSQIVLSLQQPGEVTGSPTAVADQPKLSPDAEDRCGPETDYRMSGRHFIH